MDPTPFQDLLLAGAALLLAVAAFLIAATRYNTSR